MPRGAARPEELDAGALLAAILGGSAEALDLNAAPETPDLAVRTGDLRMIVEVTRATSGFRLKRNGAAFGRAWQHPCLERDWIVVIQDEIAPRFAADTPRLIEALLVLEAAGVHFAGLNWLHERWPARPDLPPVGSELDEARLTLRDLHVELARSAALRADPRGGKIEFSFVVAPGASLERLNELVADRIKAKISKLLRTPADARHLFIWLDPSESQAHLAACREDVLPEAPALPDGLDVVWLATRFVPTFDSTDVAGVSLQRLWKLVPTQAWQLVSLSSFR